MQNLAQGQIVPLQRWQCYTYPDGKLNIYEIDEKGDKSVRIDFNHKEIKHSFAKGELTIENHGKIYKTADGKIVYEHTGPETTSTVHNVKLETQEKFGPTDYEGGNGGGFTHENREDNPRIANEDRGIALKGPALSDKESARFLFDMFNNHIIPATAHLRAGSTLSLVMRTNEGHFACAHVGDSPIFIIARNRETNEVQLKPMVKPHHIQGLTRYLGQMEEDPRIANSKPSVLIFDPVKNWPKEFEFEGIAVCSDGIDRAVGKRAVQKALQETYGELVQETPESLQAELRRLYQVQSDIQNPLPIMLSETMVNAAIPFTTDNVTVMVLPAAGSAAGDLIAVADGNKRSAEVAEEALQAVHTACKEKIAQAGTTIPDTALDNVRISFDPPGKDRGNGPGV